MNAADGALDLRRLQSAGQLPYGVPQSRDDVVWLESGNRCADLLHAALNGAAHWFEQLIDLLLQSILKVRNGLLDRMGHLRDIELGQQMIGLGKQQARLRG